MKFLLKLLINALAITAIGHFLAGITITNSWYTIIASFILVLVNVLLKPIILLFTLPLNILTLGLFTVIINAALFWLALSLTPGIEVQGFTWAFVGMVLYSAIGIVTNEVFS